MGIAVSVIVLAYNHEKYISKALDSILMQDFDLKYEIIIGDDCSTDGTQQIIRDYAEKYPEYIVPVLRQQNIGARKNSNDLYARAKGKYICCLEGDDYWIDNNKLIEQYNLLENHSEYSAVASRRIRVNETGVIIPYKHFKKDVIYNERNILKLKEMIHQSTLMQRNYFLDDKEFEKYVTLKNLHEIIGDWSSILYLVDKGDIYVSSKCYSAIRRILKPDASNFNSLYRYKKNKFDVLRMRMEYRRALSLYEFERVKSKFSVVKNAAEFRFNMLLVKSKDRTYAKEVFVMYYRSQMNILQNIMSYICIYQPAVDVIKNKIEQKIMMFETRKELGTGL